MYQHIARLEEAVRDAAGNDALDRQHAGDQVAVFSCT